MAGVEHFYEKETGTLTYILYCKETKDAVIIDPILDYDIKPSRWSTTSMDKVLDKVKELGLNVTMILETHVHADHLTCSHVLKEKLGGKVPIAIGANIVKVLEHWIPIFNIDKDTPKDGSQFDKLFAEGDSFNIGKLKVRAIYTPGHTPACNSYVLDEQKMVFVGDTVFNPEMGNARADFPGGSAKTLFESAKKIFALGDDFKVYVGHDYPENGEPVPCVTVKEHRTKNCTLHDGVTVDEFVAANSDKLPVPRLILPSLQVNLRAGGFGDKESNGIQYVKLPVNVL